MVGSEIAVPILISFGLSAALGPLVIPLLRRMKVGQTVRDDGPGTHLKKTGTPTMGGILIMLSVTVTSLLYVREYPAIIPVMVLTLGFGLIARSPATFLKTSPPRRLPPQARIPFPSPGRLPQAAALLSSACYWEI